jgi:hypothetical protein
MLCPHSQAVLEQRNLIGRLIKFAKSDKLEHKPVSCEDFMLINRVTIRYNFALYL